jgi:flagellar protein FlaG
MTIDTINSTGAASTPWPVDKSVAGTGDTTAAGTRAPAIATDTSTAVTGAAATPTLDQVNAAVTKLNKSPQVDAQGLEFSIDPDSKHVVVQLIDQKTKEVLRQIPSKEALDIAKSLDDTSKGLLIKQTA